MEDQSQPLRNVIKEIVRVHLTQKNGLALGQCLTAVGWVGGTLPELYEADGMVELSMADVAGGGFAVGAALAGRRPIYIIRYQGFNWFNAPIILNYACKSKELWGKPCPIFIRSIAMEGAIGPVAGSSHHSLYYRMPGVKIVSPMTPGEYSKAYMDFMNDDDVYYISEHRAAYGNTQELPDVTHDSPDFVLLPISITRFAALEAASALNASGWKVAVHHLCWLKPLKLDPVLLNSVRTAKYGALVLDDDYADGIAKQIAFDVCRLTGAKLNVLGLDDRTAGFARHLDNLPPNKEKIIDAVSRLVKAD